MSKYKPTEADKAVTIMSSVWFKVWQRALSIQRDLEFLANESNNNTLLGTESYVSAVKVGFDAERRYLECLAEEQYFTTEVRPKPKLVVKGRVIDDSEVPF